MSDPRYPVGRFTRPEEITAAHLQEWIQAIEEAPAHLRQAVAGLTEVQLDTPYREGGWTVRQVVHHLADAHMNSFCRLKLALTEQNPTIKPFEENDWAETPDAARAPIAPSLALLEGLHARWTVLLRSLTPEQFTRTIQHPQAGTQRVDTLTGLYAWHSRHHVGHVTTTRQRQGW